MQCWQCGREVRPGERVCSYCGARLTAPPSGRSLRPPSQSQQNSPSRYNARRSRDDWQGDDDSRYDSAYPPDDYPPDDRRGGRRPSRPAPDDDWDDPRAGRSRPPRGGSRGNYDDYGRSGSYGQSGYGGGEPGYDQSGYYDDASREAPVPPDPMNDPRAPRGLRNLGSTPNAPRRDPRDPRNPYDDRRRDDGGSRDRGRNYTPQGMPPLTQERPTPSQYGPYDSRDRYGRPSSSRGQASGYDGDFGGRSYAGGQGRSWQQRWSETVGSVRIPGLRPQQDGAEASESSSRRRITTIVLFLVLAVAVVGAGVYAGPRILAKLHPSAATGSSTLCTATGTATSGVSPTATTNQKQFNSTRSHYSMNYPETWTVTPSQKAASGYDYIDEYTLPNSSTLLNIEQAQAACALTDTNIIQDEVAAAQNQDTTFHQVTTAATTQTIGGETWQRREYDVTSSGVPLHMVILACHHQGRAYVIVLVSKTTTFKTDDSGIFEPMLKSFVFTK